MATETPPDEESVFDPARYSELKKFVDPTTGIGVIIGSHAIELKTATGLEGGKPRLLPTTDYFMEVPENLRAEMSAKTGQKVAPDGIDYVTSDVQDTLGVNLTATFGMLKDLGYPTSETTVTEAREFMRKALKIK